MFSKKKKAFIVFVACMTMLTFLCLPVFGEKEDDEKPPEEVMRSMVLPSR